MTAPALTTVPDLNATTIMGLRNIAQFIAPRGAGSLLPSLLEP